MKNDIARFQQSTGRQRPTAIDDPVIGRRKHPHLRAAHCSKYIDRTTAADKTHRIGGQRLSLIEHVANRKSAIKRKYAGERAPRASAANHVQGYCHPITS